MSTSRKTLIPIVSLLLLLPIAIAEWPATPTAPANVTAVAGPGAGQVTISWDASESVAGVTAYTIYLVADDGALMSVATTDGATLTFVHDGLDAGVSVTYVVTATDIGGESSPSEPATATTFTAPGAPVGVEAGAGEGVGETVVSWLAPESDGGLAVSWYNVYRNGELVTQTVETTWTDGALTPLHDYTYHVSATNDAGEGPRSDGSCTMAAPWVADPAVPSCLGLA